VADVSVSTSEHSNKSDVIVPNDKVSRPMPRDGSNNLTIWSDSQRQYLMNKYPCLCILFLWTLSIVLVFLNKTQRFRDWLCLRPQVIKKEGQEGGDPIWWVP
jgi:hypothetical protein